VEFFLNLDEEKCNHRLEFFFHWVKKEFRWDIYFFSLTYYLCTFIQKSKVE
jgi:hypothetical protein